MQTSTGLWISLRGLVLLAWLPALMHTPARAQGYLRDDAATNASTGITLNEVSARSAVVDFNADGSVNASSDKDEFIELLNTSDTTIDIGGWMLCDSTGCLTFTAGTSVGPGQAVIVFARNADVSNFDPGTGNVVFAGPSGLQLSNANDAVGLRNAADRYLEVHWGSGVPAAGITGGATLVGTAEDLGSSWGEGVSKTRFPDGTGPWNNHITLSGTHDWSRDGTVAVTDPEGSPGRTADGVVLPVEWTAFEAVVDGTAAVLRWATASETNNAGFEIQHSKFAAANLENVGATLASPAGWKVVAYVEGHGTTEQPQTYRYRVDGLPPGRHRFRLKQVDFDGTFAYSPEVEVAIRVPGIYVLTPAYPNPFNPATTFSLSVARAQRVEVAVYDVLGRRVALLHDGVLPEETARVFRFEAGDLPGGRYLLRVAGAQFHASHPLTLVK